MAKKQDRRRQDRRRHHQTVQDTKRRAHRRAVHEAVEKVQSAFGQFAGESADESVAPETFARHARELLDDDLFAELLALPELAADRGAAMAEEAGPQRAAALAAALAAHADGHPSLS